MVGIGDAHIGSGGGGNVGNDVVVDAAVIGVQPHFHGDVGVQRVELGNGLLVDIGLGDVGVVLGPEGDGKLAAGIQLLWQLEAGALPGPVAAGKGQQQGGDQQQGKHSFFHPLVPPLATPAMIFLWKSRNSTISGREITTTAAIMAGMFSRPKPFSRIS